jgi:hypothetical protein
MDGNRYALLRENSCDRLADTNAAAGHQGALAVQLKVQDISSRST